MLNLVMHYKGTLVTLSFYYCDHLSLSLWVKQLAAYARLKPATLRSSPFGVNSMLRPPPKLYIYSCGWTDAPDHKETIASGLVFDRERGFSGRFGKISGRGNIRENFGAQACEEMIAGITKIYVRCSLVYW